MINYSIIIPTKNIPNLLIRCLASIPERDDIEIIIIDDNSDSSKVDFDNYPGKDRKNTKIIFSNENKGAGAARNRGLEVATGKWLVFIDSDDFLMPCANTCFDKYINDNSDIIFFLHTSVCNDTLKPSDRHLRHVRTIKMLQQDKTQLERFLRFGFTEPWCKFIKKSMVDKYKLSFQESLVANDYWFSIQTGYHADKISLCEKVFYCVTTRSGSLCNNLFDNDAKILSRLSVCKTIQDFAKSHKIGIIPFDFFVELCVRHAIRVDYSILKTLKVFFNESKISVWRHILKSCINTINYRLKCKVRKEFIIR